MTLPPPKVGDPPRTPKNQPKRYFKYPPMVAFPRYEIKSPRHKIILSPYKTSYSCSPKEMVLITAIMLLALGACGLLMSVLGVK